MQRNPLRPLPQNKTPVGTRCIQITIPDDDEWEQAAYSELYRLAMWMLWNRDDNRQGTVVAKQWKKALRTWRHCSDQSTATLGEDVQSMPEFRTVCDGDAAYLEWKTCTCPETWERLAPTTIVPLPSGQLPPGTGTPGPGGLQQYCQSLLANAIITLPPVVSTGDIITLNSAEGGWYDGSGSLVWNCPSGLIYFADECGGTSHLDGGDPVPTAPHMSVVVAIGGTFYALPLATPFTVPVGILNQPVRIQANDSGLANNQGSADICITIQNNAVPTWTQIIDFTLTDGLFVYDPFGAYVPPYIGNWVPSSGWTGSINNPDPVAGTSTVLRIKRDLLGTFTITDTVVSFHTDQVQADSGRGIAFGATALTIPDGSGDQTYHDPTNHVGPFSINIGMGTAHSGGGATGAIILTKLIFQGSGTNPFL